MKYVNGYLSALSLFALVSGTAHAQKGSLTLDGFLDQVRMHNFGYAASKAAASSAADRADEGDLLLSPRVLANVQQLVDEKETVNPMFQGTKTTASGASLGVSKLTSFGLQAKLSYNLGYTKIEGLTPAAPGAPTEMKAYDAYPSLELSQSLWRNFFGSETRAMVELTNAQANATQFGEKYKTKLVLLEAESTFWRYALAKEVIEVQKDRLARSTKLRNWSASRAKSGLADRADFLQSEAAVRVSQLELQAAIDDERSAARSLNRMRGIESSEVNESMPKVSDKLIEQASLPKYSGGREDVLAAKETERLAKANAALNAEKLRPNLELFGTFALNGRDEAMSRAESESFKNDHPTRLVGLRFNAPLDLSQVSRTKSAYLRDQNAAELNAKQREYDAEREWQDLRAKFTEAKTRFQLARAIEKAQGEKVDHERVRYSRGRSTTAQVLMFEQDFSLSQLSRIKAQGDVLNVATQLKLFAGGN